MSMQFANKAHKKAIVIISYYYYHWAAERLSLSIHF